MSFITVSVDEKEFKETLNWLKAKPSQVERAERRAVTKTLRYVGAFAARTIAIASRVPIGVLRRGGGTSAGVRLRHDLPKGRETDGSVWIGANPIKAAYVGKVRQLRKGARAGRHLFLGGFVARMASGHVGIFKRKTNRSLPIMEQRVALQNAEQAVRAAQGFIPARLNITLAQEINFEVNVRGR